jgi:cytochrome P450
LGNTPTQSNADPPIRAVGGAIIDHMIFLMMAAHDTTTSTLSSLLYELARHPDWQARVREECRAGADDTAGYDDLGRLATLSMVVNETLRLYPPLSTIAKPRDGLPITLERL